METLIRDYDRLRPLVTSIKAGTGATTLIGEGAESQVWRAIQGDTSYAIKLMKPFSPRGIRRDIPVAISRTAEVGLRGVGINGLEQVRAASPNDGAIVYDYIQGVSVSKMISSDAINVTDSQLAALMETVEYATDAGIEFDGWNDSGGNAIYSPEDGFTFIDYWGSRSINLQNNTKYAFRSLGAVGIELAKRIDLRI